MARELLLFRHGKLIKHANSNELSRPLKAKSKRAAQSIGIWLTQNNLKPDLVICSNALSTWSSAQKCCKAMGIPAFEIQQDSSIFGADGNMLIKILSRIDSQYNRVLLVAHHSGMQELLSHLGVKKDQPKKSKSILPSASLAQLRISRDWSEINEDKAELVTLLKASSLRNGFPYPEVHSKKTRCRPAYYYTQSGVLPYRSRKGRTEILIVSSSNNKHWVVPKGIVDPGHTPKESAIKEAFEEAGIIGSVPNIAIGNYKYRKWGAKCKVTLYPMHVTRLLPRSAWEEKHRKRRWVSIKRASKMLHHRIDVQKLIKPIIDRV